MGFVVGSEVGVAVGATVGATVGAGCGGAGVCRGAERTTTTCLSGTHWTYAPRPSEMTRTGTTTAPRYISGGTSSGRVSPLISISGLPTVTFMSEPGLETSTVLVAES